MKIECAWCKTAMGHVIAPTKEDPEDIRTSHGICPSCYASEIAPTFEAPPTPYLPDPLTQAYLGKKEEKPQKSTYPHHSVLQFVSYEAVYKLPKEEGLSMTSLTHEPKTSGGRTKVYVIPVDAEGRKHPTRGKWMAWDTVVEVVRG